MNTMASAARSIVRVLLPVLGSVATPLVCPVPAAPPWFLWGVVVGGCGAGVRDDVAGPLVPPADGDAEGPAPWLRVASRPDV
jgi:hypothetical protein